MRDSARYAKIVEWSDEDQCFVGSAPGLLDGGCHGDDETQVFCELCEIAARGESSRRRPRAGTSPRGFRTWLEA